MKKLSIILIAAFLFGYGAVSAQCTINTSNTTTGITPTNPDDTLTQGVAYNQTFQVYVPSTYSGFGVDSVHISSITGAPSGLTIVYNPADGGGGTVAGGGTGAICFSGTTHAAVGAYPLTFNGTIYTTVTSVPLSTLASDFSYTFNVKAPAQQASSCDTLFNLATDTPTLYTAGVTADSGYVSGNNIYGDMAKAEGFKAVIGDYVNSAILFFAETAIASTDSGNLVTIGVWDNTGTSAAGNAGAPGNMIDSVHVTLGQIAQAVTATNNAQQLVGLLVNFPGTALTTDTFYVGVVLPQTYGDTVALFTNITPGADGDGWEYEVGQSGNVWGTYNNDWGFGGNIGNYIIANICGSAASGTPVSSFTLVGGNCAPDTVAFTDASSSNPAASGFSWSFGDGGYSSQQDPTYVYAAGGTYTVTEYASNNLGGAIQAFTGSSQTVTVTASPSATATATDASTQTSDNGGVMVTVTGGLSPYTYHWNADNSTSDTIANVNPGVYTVTVVDGNHCTATATATVYVTGIVTLSNSNTVTVYPNPASDVLNMVWSQKSNADVSVIDLNGNVIGSFTTVGEMKNVYNIHDLASGNYILRFTDRNTNQQQSMMFSKF